MGQSGGADHQRGGERGHIEGAAANRGGVFLKAQIQQGAVELLQKICAIGKGRAQPDLRYRLTGQLQADKNRRHGVGKNQHAELGDLGVGNAFHTAQHGIEEDDDHARKQTGLIIRLEKAREGHTNTLHLPDDISHRANNEADHRHDARGIGVIPIAYELGDGELPVFPQVWRDQHGQNHITTGPAHQKYRAAIAVVRETNETRHGDERSGRHPVSRRCHTVGHRVNALSGDVEFLRRSGARADCDKNIKRKGCAHDQIGGFSEAHASGSSNPRRFSRRAITRA